MQTLEQIFGAAVRDLRREKQRISQEDFADKAGIHRTYVSSIELGKVKVSIAIAEKLAVVLEFPLSNSGATSSRSGKVELRAEPVSPRRRTCRSRNQTSRRRRAVRSAGSGGTDAPGLAGGQGVGPI